MSHDWPHLSESYLDLLNLSELINFHTSVRDAQGDILKSALNVFKAESGQFCLHTSHTCAPDKNHTALVNLSWKYTDQYIKYYHQLDPFIKTMPEASACRDIDIMPKTAWQKHEFNYDFILPQKIRHLLVIHLRNTNEIVGHIGLHRYDSDFPFSRKDLFKARFLSALFSRQLVQKQLIQKLASLENLLKQIMVIPSMGIVILDSQLQPVYWNSRTMEFGFSFVSRQGARARAAMIETKQADFWEGGPVFTASRYCPLLPQEVLNECGKIQKAIQNKPVSKYDNQQINVWSGPGRGLGAEIVVLPNEQSSNSTSDPYYLVIILNKIERVHSQVSAEGNCIDKLTPKESEIAKYICQGLTNKEISSKLFISLPTVATHVQHIFQKLEIKSRSKLIRRLLL